MYPAQIKADCPTESDHRLYAIQQQAWESPTDPLYARCIICGYLCVLLHFGGPRLSKRDPRLIDRNYYPGRWSIC